MWHSLCVQQEERKRSTTKRQWLWIWLVPALWRPLERVTFKKKLQNWTRGGYWTTVTSTFPCNEAPVSFFFYSLETHPPYDFIKTHEPGMATPKLSLAQFLPGLWVTMFCFKPSPSFETEMQKSGVYIHHLPLFLKNRKLCVSPPISSSQHITLCRA